MRLPLALLALMALNPVAAVASEAPACPAGKLQRVRCAVEGSDRHARNPLDHQTFGQDRLQ